jgi:hypothetical protein
MQIMTKILDLRNAKIQFGQAIIPGAKPNSAPKGFGRDGKRPKKMHLFDRDHGVHPAEGVVGGHLHQPSADTASVPVHDGMKFKESGQLKAGISRTAAMSPTDDANFTAGIAPARDGAVHERPVHYSQTGGIGALAGRSLPKTIVK